METNLHLTVAAIIEKNDKFLLVEEVSDGKTVINQPAGHWEPNETLEQAVIREALEETAYDFAPQSICGIYTWQKPDSADFYIRVCYTGQLGELDKNRNLDKDIIRTLWLSQMELVAQNDKLRSPLVLSCVNDYLRGVRLDLDVIQEILN